MEKEKARSDFTSKKKDETRYCFLDEIIYNEKTRNIYIQYLLFLVSTFTACVSISGLAFLVGIPLRIRIFE